MMVLRLLAVCALAASVGARTRFTGVAVDDFKNTAALYAADVPHTTVRPALEAFADLYVPSDVSVPKALGVNVFSGFDIERVFFEYDPVADELHIGIDCFGVCGDADGDGNAGAASAALQALGGSDFPDLSRDESFLVLLDLNNDVVATGSTAAARDSAPFDFAIGVPGGQPDRGATLACSVGQSGDDYLSMNRCFGLYVYSPSTTAAISQRLLRPVREGDGSAVWPVRNENPVPRVTKPDLEWTIERFALLRAQAGAPVSERLRDAFTFRALAFGGSFADDGVGEDFVPDGATALVVNVPCSQLDACGVCFGDNTTCADCHGVPNGGAKVDLCGVCGGNNNTCRDCRGVHAGSARYDACGVCGGNGSTCLDCAGKPAGPARYDWCGVCNGNGRSCADCKGVPNGKAVYDKCGVCGGDGTSCCGEDGECCVNYGGVPDDMWNYYLLPITLENLIELFERARNLVVDIGQHMPAYASLDDAQVDELQLGRFAEFNRLYLDECHKPYCEESTAFNNRLLTEINAH